MDELRNMLRQSFNLPVEPVGVVDEKDDTVDAESQRGRNFGYINEITFPLVIASYLFKGSVDINEILSAIQDRLTPNVQTYEISKLFRSLSPAERKDAEKQENIRMTGKEVEDYVQDKLDDIYEKNKEHFNPNQITIKKHILPIKSFVAMILGIRVPSSKVTQYLSNPQLRTKHIDHIINRLNDIGNKNDFSSKGVKTIPIQSGPNLYYIYKLFNNQKEADDFLRNNSQKLNITENELFENDKSSETVTFSFLTNKDKESPWLLKAKAIIKEKNKVPKDYKTLLNLINSAMENLNVIGVDDIREPLDVAKKNNKPYTLEIKVVGGEGVSGDTAGEIKGDIEVSLNANGQHEERRFSLKADNKTVATLKSNTVFYEYITKAVVYAGLKKIPWKNSKKVLNVPSEEPDPNILIDFQNYAIHDLDESEDSKLVFALVDTLAHGFDDATLLSITKQSHELKSLSPVISEYIRTMHAKTVASEAGQGDKLGTKFRIRDRADPKIMYGILVVNKSGQVQLDGKLDKLIQKLKNIFGEGADEKRILLWDFNRKFTFTNMILEKVKAGDPITKPIANRINHYLLKSEEAISEFRKTNPRIVKLASNSNNYVDTMKELGIFEYALGNNEDVGENDVESYIIGMAHNIIDKLEGISKSSKRAAAE